MKKVLFFNFNCCWGWHFETELELMTLHKEAGDKVFSVDCNKVLNEQCISALASGHKCERCRKALILAYDILKLPLKQRLRFKKIKKIKFPKFETVQDLKNYKFNGVNIGFGVYSSYIHSHREYEFDPVEKKVEIDEILNAANAVAVNFDEIVERIKPDLVYIFNGRFAEHYPIVQLCRKYNIDYYLHERGATKDKYHLIKNDILHRFNRYQEEIDYLWKSETNEELKSSVAKKWFTDRRAGVEQSWVCFTKEQVQNKLPKNFDFKKENIAIFNSSIDEYVAFDDWTNPLDKNQNNIILNIVEKFKNDETKHFYLRIHPNLKDVKSKQIQELEEIKKAQFKNLTVIAPEDDIDSYFLMEQCDKTITFISTMGIEATFWGKPSILAGKSIYDKQDCVYKVVDYNDLYKLINEKNLLPKSRENCYPYSYWLSTIGVNFKYFKPLNLFIGTFKGVALHKYISNWQILLMKIKSLFY